MEPLEEWSEEEFGEGETPSSIGTETGVRHPSPLGDLLARSVPRLIGLSEELEVCARMMEQESCRKVAEMLRRKSALLAETATELQKMHGWIDG